MRLAGLVTALGCGLPVLPELGVSCAWLGPLPLLRRSWHCLHATWHIFLRLFPYKDWAQVVQAPRVCPSVVCVAHALHVIEPLVPSQSSHRPPYLYMHVIPAAHVLYSIPCKDSVFAGC